MRFQGGKEQRTAGQRRRTVSYCNATYEVRKSKGVIETLLYAWYLEGGGMKEVTEQHVCDQRREIWEKHWLEELEMETIKQKCSVQRLHQRHRV